MKTETLIVDDDAVICLIHEKLLSAAGCAPAARVFRHGLDVLNFLRADYSPETRYLIFLDLNMPVMDGWQFLNEIKDFPRTNIQIWIVSSSIFSEDRERAKSYPHVADFLEKPLSTARLRDLQVFPDHHMPEAPM